MTKEEFLSMLNSELEKLKLEHQSAINTYNYFRETSPNSVDYKNADLQLSIIESRVYSLKQLLTLPAYARIQAMSDVEIEEYKKRKIEELELKIKEIQAKVEQEEMHLSKLLEEQQQLIDQLATDSGNRSIIARGQALSREISDYDHDNQWGVFATLQKQIDDLRKQQDKIISMTSQEIKQQLSSEIKDNYKLTRIIERAKKINEFTELKASVASDPKKARQMARLLSIYTGLSMQGERIELSSYGLPSTLVKKLMGKPDKDFYSYAPKTIEASNFDKLMKTIQEFEETFEQAKKIFNEQFTEEKMSKLIHIDYTKIDIEFLQQHTDKFDAGELDNLLSLVEQRKKLSNKIIKTRNIRDEIDDLDDKIKKLQNKIYKKIIDWYKFQLNNILGLNRNVNFYNLDELQQSLIKCRQDIENSEKAIAEFKEKAQKQKQDRDTKIAEITQQIRDLGGEEYIGTDISYASTHDDDNLGRIVNAQNFVYERDIIDSVQQEAQKQADITEAELKGITVEQLLQMRQQEQAMVDESSIEAEVPHKINR